MNPNEGYQININNFNLNNFIPNTPYYFFYVKTETCKQSNIVFDMLKSGQTISQTAIDKLSKALLENRVTSLYPAVTSQTLYINSNGPNLQGKATDDKIKTAACNACNNYNTFYKKKIRNFTKVSTLPISQGEYLIKLNNKCIDSYVKYVPSANSKGPIPICSS